MAHSNRKLLGLCRDTLRRWFHDRDGTAIDFDALPEPWRLTILAAAETASRTHEQPKFAIEEAYRSLMVMRLDQAEDLRGPHS